MARLKLQKVLSSEIGKRRILIRPQEPTDKELIGDSPNGIYLGKTQMLHTPFIWDYKRLTNPHVAVVGMSGSGKSYFIKTFITKAFRTWGTNCLILDWSGEYTPWVEQVGGTVINLGTDASINLLDCKLKTRKHISLTPKVRTEQILSALKILTNIATSAKQIRLTKYAIEKAYLSKGFNLDKPISYKSKKKIPTLHDVKKIFQIALRKTSDDDLEECLDRINSLCSKSVGYFSSQNAINLDDLINNGVVSVNLSNLNSDIHRSLAGLTILQHIKLRMRDELLQNRKSLRLIVVADEAWKIAQDERSDLVAILREGRKYAFSLIIASQNPSDISKTILSNSATVVVFRLMLKEFRQYMLQSMHADADAIIEVERFSTGKALFRLAFSKPGFYDGPFIISRIEADGPPPIFHLKVFDMSIELNREEFRKKLWRLGCTDKQISRAVNEFEANDRELNADSLAYLLTTLGLSNSIILSFFRDIGIKDSDLVKLFSVLQARSLGAKPQDMYDLVITDEKTKKKQ